METTEKKTLQPFYVYKMNKLIDTKISFWCIKTWTTSSEKSENSHIVSAGHRLTPFQNLDSSLLILYKQFFFTSWNLCWKYFFVLNIWISKISIAFSRKTKGRFNKIYRCEIVPAFGRFFNGRVKVRTSYFDQLESVTKS